MSEARKTRPTSGRGLRIGVLLCWGSFNIYCVLLVFSWCFYFILYLKFEFYYSFIFILNLWKAAAGEEARGEGEGGGDQGGGKRRRTREGREGEGGRATAGGGRETNAKEKRGDAHAKKRKTQEATKGRITKDKKLENIFGPQNQILSPPGKFMLHPPKLTQSKFLAHRANLCSTPKTKFLAHRANLCSAPKKCYFLMFSNVIAI